MLDACLGEGVCMLGACLCEGVCVCVLGENEGVCDGENDGENGVNVVMVVVGEYVGVLQNKSTEHLAFLVKEEEHDGSSCSTFTQVGASNSAFLFRVCW